ncbi:helix-turn-helix domain-containing protein [Pseudonocardia acaciae]|uniref:helix-turn-helix domain-containing protein n=1 Tax=Pseudonocardia acaciae TaxID=551276 RepID=UPI00048B8EA3|nr:helix-turn-helix transcriptional regulator [Pseudonocardia acaciae]
MSLQPEWSEADRTELAGALRELRRASGLSGAALGAKVYMSQAKVSRIETGRIVPSVTDVELLVHALQVEPERARELVGLARVANTEHQSNRVMQRRGYGTRQRDHLAMEEQCRLRRQFLPTVLGGVMQIPAYTRRAVTDPVLEEPESMIEEIMAGKRLRRAVLDRPDKRFEFVLTEAALRTRLLDATGMTEQMDDLVATAARPNVTVEVIPFSTELPTGPLNMFSIYDDRLVAIEDETGLLMLRDPTDIRYYTDLFEVFRGYALRGDEAREFVRSVADDYRRET